MFSISSAITAVFLFLGLFGTVLEYCMKFDVKINLIKVEHKNSIKYVRLEPLLAYNRPKLD